MRRALGLWLAFFTATVSWAEAPVIAVSNLTGGVGTGYGGFGSAFGTAESQAVSFITGNTPASLSTISIQFDPYYAVSLSDLGPVVVSLYNNSDDVPGASLATLTGNQYPTNTAIYTFTNTTPLTLSTNTPYWIVISSPTSINGALYYWGMVGGTTTNAGSVWSIGPNSATRVGVNSWNTLAGLYAQFSLAVVPQVPQIKISSSAQTNAVLSYFNSEFPFVLQQNDDLTTSNWVNVPDVEAETILSNQTSIVTAPFSGQHMFYRLSL